MRLLVLTAAGLACCLHWGCGDQPILQPLNFSHKLHAEQDLGCVDCHQHFETQTFSGLPGLDVCMECHEEPQGDSPEEEKLRKAAEEGTPLAWKRLFRVPDHVYYSHRRHVVIGKISCEHCHGETGLSEKPPTRAPVDLSMDFCMGCHEETGVENECITCHR